MSSFSWVAADNPNTTGESTSIQNTSTITDVITNLTRTFQTVIYNVTQTGTTNNCSGDPFTVFVMVDPMPVTSNVTDNICSNVALSHSLQADVTNGLISSFSWVAADNLNTTGESTSVQTGVIINDVISNLTNSIEMVVYTVTPMENANSCVGNPFTVTVAVDPLPMMTISDNVGFTGVICSGDLANFQINSTVTNAIIRLDNVSNTLGVTGFSTVGATFVATDNINDVLTNITNSPVTIVYEFSVSVRGCDDKAPAFTKSVTVNPNPTFTITNNSFEICSGDVVDIVLNSSTTSHQINLVTVTYGTVTGDGSEVRSGDMFTNGNNIVDVLNNNTNAPVTVTYEFNVSTLTTPSCPLSTVSQFARVVVNPNATFNVTNNEPLICSGEATDIDISSTISGVIIELIDIVSSSASLVGIPAISSTYLSGANLQNTITNPTNVTQTIDYTFRVSFDGCVNGSTLTRTVTITPIPEVVLSVLAQTICNGDFTSIDLINANGVAGTTYTWNVVQATGITGASAITGSATTTISQQLSNSTNIPNIATYTIIPFTSGCNGVSKTIIVTVNPTPSLSTSGGEVICSGETTNIVLNNTNNVAGTTYSWMVVNNSHVSGAVSGVGSTIAQDLLVDANENPGVVTYHITPSTDGCDGSFIDVNVTVNPIPLVNPGIDYEVCEDGTISLTALLSGATSYATWTGGNNAATGYSNGGASIVDNEIITYSFDAVDISAGFVVFTLTTDDPDLAAGPCSATSADIKVTIHELPVVTLSIGSPNLVEIGELSSPAVFIVSPFGGTFSGDGVDGNFFNPLEATVNANNFVTYTYIDANDCTNAITNTIFVKGRPPLPTLDEVAVCFNDDPIVLLQLVDGQIGSWSGTGVSVDGTGVYTFTPEDAGVGSHLIKFDITINGSSNSSEQSFFVVPSAVADFEALNFCIDAPIEFQDNSTIDSQIYPSEIVDWDWAFGDDIRSSLRNPTNKYATSRDYVVTLDLVTKTPIEINGDASNIETCFVQVSKTIMIGAKPIPSFDWKGVCGNESTQFTNTTTLNGATISTYTWDFGDFVMVSGIGSIVGVSGTTGAFESPLHQYATNGVYNVTLSINTDKGCTNSFTQKIGILPSNLNNFPYFEDFNADDGGWIASADFDLATNYVSDTSWVWGIPNASNINSSESNAWWTGKNKVVTGDATYFANESSYVNGLCFDLSTLQRPMITMDIWVDVQEEFDGVALQYSNGNEWINVGFINEGLNWYDGQGIVGMARNQLLGRYGWTQNTDGWVNARFSLDHIPVRDRESVRFRIAFGSDTNTPESEVYNGFCF